MNECLLEILNAYEQFKAEIMGNDERKIKEITITENEDVIVINVKLASEGERHIIIPLQGEKDGL